MREYRPGEETTGNIEEKGKEAHGREIVFTGIKLFGLVARLPLRLTPVLKTTRALR